MLHRIKGLFQKTLDLKVEKFGENKSNSLGRSMVEMLGVLAIVGVLSIGALAGYNYAMDKYRASETINDINARGVDLIIQASRNIPLNLDEWGTKSSAGYTFGTPELVDGFVKLPISGLPERVCEMVADGLSSKFDVDVGADRYAGDTSLCGENNTLTVYFDAGSGEGAGGESDPCGGCPGAQTCVDGACICTNGGTGENCEIDLCAGVTCGDCQKCQNGSCVTKDDYESCTGGYCESGICISNENPETIGSCTTSEDCGNSCMFCVDGLCAFKKEGTACGENGVCKNASGIKDCVYPCSEDHPLKDSSGNCHSCDTRASIYVGSTGNCLTCSNREEKNGYCLIPECPADRPLMNSIGYCYSCDTPSSFWVGSYSCSAVCPNRKLNNGYCVLSECPADKPLRDYEGNCYSCDRTSRVFVSGVTGNCAVCKDRVLSGDKNSCVLPCPADKPLMDYYGACHSCDRTSRVFVSGVTGNCAVCKDRVLSGNYCLLPCPSDKPLMGSNGTCYSCNTTSSVYVYGATENCAVCSSNRKLDGNYCVLK